MKKNINLLSIEKQRRIHLSMLLAMLLPILLLGNLYLLINKFVQQQELKEIQQIVQEQENIIQEAEHKLMRPEGEVTSENFLDYYRHLDIFLGTTFLKPIDIIRNVTNPLPPGACIHYYQFLVEGRLEMEGNFRNMKDISNYLQALLKNPLIVQANVSNIMANTNSEWTDVDPKTLDPNLAVAKPVHYIATFKLKVKNYVGEHNE